MGADSHQSVRGERKAIRLQLSCGNRYDLPFGPLDRRIHGGKDMDLTGDLTITAPR